MKEATVLEYAQLGAKDYIPGAEVLRDTNEIEAELKEQGLKDASDQIFYITLLLLQSLVVNRSLL